MARFSFDFDVDDIMQSIEDELAEIIQSELGSEEDYMFQKLPSNSQKLIDDILAADNPVEMLQNRFGVCSDREDDELRGMIGDLVENGYIKVFWGDNVPYHIQIKNSARTYHEQLAEYERVLQAQSRITNNYPVNLYRTGRVSIEGGLIDAAYSVKKRNDRGGYQASIHHSRCDGKVEPR